jgi:hypothetical protein
MGLINSNYIYYKGDYITNEEYKNILKSRNLYNSNKQYLDSDFRDRLIDTTSKLINLAQPFETYDLRNTIYGRLITLPNTPLVDIGLLKLGEQLFYNTKSKLSKELIPNINLKNIFNNEDVITPNKNFGITKKTDDESTWFSETFLNSISNFYPQSLSPFSMSSPKGTYEHNSKKLIEHTKDETLNLLFDKLNFNIYKNSEYNLKNNNFTGIDYFSSQSLFRNIGIDDLDAINYANDQYIKSRNEFSEIEGEYGSYFAFVRHFGITNKKDEPRFNYKSNNEWIIPNRNNPNENLVWGRDGISLTVENNIQNSRGVDRNEIAAPVNYNKFNVKTGLLEYTRNLLIANRGNKIDITRKVFKKGVSNRIEGFQGSPLWKSPESSPLTNAGEPLRGTVGKRQHTVLDQYDNFAKAIRFDGNKLYDGSNENSVIYNSVIPRIHPTKDDNGVIDQKNLMFSIENLAARTIDLGSYGLIDDGDRGIPIPSSEVGPLMGRLMWFAPYDIQFSETADNTFETTVMMGRGEPMYNYQYTERGATIRFKLLIDHPQKVKGMLSYKEVSEFFAFGGHEDDNFPNNPNINEIEKRIIDVGNEIAELLRVGETSQLDNKYEELEKLEETLIKEKGDKLNKREYNLREDKEDAILDNFESITKNKFYPGFYSQTPEEFHRRLTFLHQCMRQGKGVASTMETDDSGMLRARNSVFGRQPISIIRVGDLYNTKVIIQGLTIDYEDATWDMNPEGFGMQPMICDITLNVKMVGGHSLEGPISALQNAISFNHYANSTYGSKDVYKHA